MTTPKEHVIDVAWIDFQLGLVLGEQELVVDEPSLEGPRELLEKAKVVDEV